MLGLEKTGKRSLSWGCWLGSSTTALRARLESPWDFVGRCGPMALRCSTSTVPIGGSRLFRPKVIGEGEDSVSAVTGTRGPLRISSTGHGVPAREWLVLIG